MPIIKFSKLAVSYFEILTFDLRNVLLENIFLEKRAIFLEHSVFLIC